MREMREAMRNLSQPTLKGSNLPTPAVISKREAEFAAAEATTTLAAIFPSFPDSELDSIIKRIAEKALFSEDIIPLDNLFNEM